MTNDDGGTKYSYEQTQYDRQRIAHEQCEAGVEYQCSYGEQHPVEVATFAIGSFALAGAAEYFVFSGGLAGVADTAMYKAGLACLKSVICRVLVGAVGGSGAGNQVDYYVTADGQAVPSTGYRYSAGSGFNNSIADGTLPARADGTYFTFEYYTEQAAAKSYLQLPYLPQKGVSFDTLQIIDDIHVPHGMYGASSILEPIVVDFPNFGVGGATQAITYSPIQINGWWWLK